MEFTKKLRGYLARLMEPDEHWANQFVSKLMTTVMPNQELPDPLDFVKLAEMGFRRNAVVMGCVRKISRSVAEPQLKAVTVGPDGAITVNLPGQGDALADLMWSPNDEQDSYEFFEQLLIHLMVAGNAFIYKVRAAAGGPPVALELIRPDLIGIIPGADRSEGKIKGYTIRLNQVGQIYPIAKKDIIHVRLPDAFDEFWGLSPLYTCSAYGDIDLQAADFLRGFFRNRGIPSGLLTFDKPVQKTERERIRELFKDQFEGKHGWHQVGVLDANVQYKQLSSNIADMNLDGITNQTETRICMVFGVPPVLIGSLVGLSKASFTSMDVSEKMFWTDTMTPMFQRIGRRLTMKLAHEEFGADRQVIFDLSTVAALNESKSEMRKIAISGWRFGLLTRNQSQKMLGLAQEDENGDVYFQLNTAVVVPAGAIQPNTTTVSEDEITETPPQT